jgi:hypothetical protein
MIKALGTSKGNFHASSSSIKDLILMPKNRHIRELRNIN